MFRGIPWSEEFLTLIALSVISLAGFSFVWPLTSIYVTTVLGQPMTVAGLVLAMEAAAGMVGSFLGGSLYDRLGGKPVIICSALLVPAAVACLLAIHTWGGFLMSFSLMNLSMGSLSTCVNACVSDVCPDVNRSAYNLIYIARNVGVSMGVALGGLVASHSFTDAFLLTGICFAVIPLLVRYGFRKVSLGLSYSPRERAALTQEFSHQNRSATYLLIMLGIGGLCTMVSYMQWQSTISVFMQALGQPLGRYSLLWTVNGVLSIAFQPLSHVVIRWFPSERMQLVVGEVIFALSFVVLTVDTSYAGFVMSMVLATFAEVLVWPMIPAVTSRIAPDGKVGIYQGMMDMFNKAGRLAGPAMGAALYQWYGAPIMLWAMIGTYIVAMACFATCKLAQGAPAMGIGANRQIPVQQ